MPDLSFDSFSGSVRPTSRGLYDNDTDFQQDADKIVYHVMRSLGSPAIDAALDLRVIWDSFEQATVEYSQTINTYHAKNIMLDLLGTGTGSLSGSENAYPLGNSMEFSRRSTLQYSHEFGANSPWEWKTASVTTVGDQQVYDLWSIISASVPEGSNVQIRKIHHYEDVAAFRFFDTTSVLNFMGNSLGFESYSPETIFYLLPIWEDVLRGTQLALNQRVRRSNYSFDLRGFDLRIYPTPTKAKNIFFEYTISRDPLSASIGGRSLHTATGVVSNLSNIAFGHLGYSDINSIGKTWIWRMTVAFCKERLGEVRQKYENMPIPLAGQSVNLNGTELIQRAREDQLNLRQELREILEQMSYKNLMSERSELQDLNQKELSRVPLLMYRSR